MKIVQLLAIFLFISCGYKPSAHYIRAIFTDKVYVEVEVDMIEPENAPFLKDEMNRVVYTRFKGRVAHKDQATSSIRLSYKGSSFMPLAYVDGYVTRYRANTKVRFDLETKEGKMTKLISAIVESDIQASSLTSSTLRTQAITKGLEKALDEFVAYISAKGLLASSPVVEGH